MLPSAGSASVPPPHPEPSALPHTRTRPVHWIATTAALAAVVGASAFLQPTHATATPVEATAGTPSPAASVPGITEGPDPAMAHYAMECGPEKPGVIAKASGDLDGDGRAETVAVVRCTTGFGTPPSGIYVLAHPADSHGRPRVVETLLDPKEGLSVMDLAVRGRTISVTLLGYSSKSVPRCCPDQQRKVKWQWHEGKFALTALPVPGSV